MVLPPPAGLPCTNARRSTEEHKCQTLWFCLLSIYSHCMDWYTSSMGIIQKLIQTEITLSDDSSILVLENDFRFKIESKQFIHLTAEKFPASATAVSASNGAPSAWTVVATGHRHTRGLVLRTPSGKKSSDRFLTVTYWTNQFLLKSPHFQNENES